MRYTLGIDIGGTFTDLIMVSDAGGVTVHKTLSTPRDPSQAFLNGLRELAEINNLPFRRFIRDIDAIVHGTTVSTNA